MFVQHTDIKNDLEENDASSMEASFEIDEFLPTTVRYRPIIRIITAIPNTSRLRI
jgi:hypothetical protein